VELVRWSEESCLVSDLVESSEVGSELVQLGSCSDSHRGLQIMNTEAEGSTVLEAITR
jgi:hypothetical protein